jgi:hypothetical protein
MTTEHTPPPKPYHRWKSNETTRTIPYSLDRCLSCQVLRTSPKAADACPTPTDPR